MTESRIVRRVRLRLLAWSGGTTLVLLVLLGLVIYAAVSTSLASAGTSQLRERAAELASGVPAAEGVGVGTIGGGSLVVGEGTAPGLVIGGPTSGTLAFIVGPGVEAGAMGTAPVIRALRLPDQSGVQAALTADGESVVETDLQGVPVRILSTPISAPGGTLVVQVVGDRTAELRTLAVLLAVLLVGGLLVLLASLVVGWLYADRALVPIREAMRHQREFAADASHELRTPLAVIRGNVEALRRRPDRPPAELQATLAETEAEVDRLGAMVDDLLLLARTDSGALEIAREPVDLAEVALDAAGSLVPAADAAGVRIEVDAEPFALTGDQARLRQLVGILLDNAIRHAPRGTTVEVSVAGAGDEGRLRVDDRGPGFRDEDLPRVFDRFWRAADAPAGGTGLGLAIAAWIVARHGGSIVAANRPDGGARLEVSLPAR
jgi:two-component system, OmpR family, sensor histidine kinase CiaH